MKKLNLSGQRFGRLIVLSEVPKRGSFSCWRCRCDCGNETNVLTGNLGSGHTQSCGCRRQEAWAQVIQTHGGRDLNCYTNWKGMISRCYNGNIPEYERYGGRGIRVCEFLRSTPFNLLLALGEKPTSKHSIDRYPDTRGHYVCGSCSECLRLGLKKNVRWATRAQQSRNTTRNKWLTFNGETKCLRDWAIAAGINPETFRARIKRGADPFALGNACAKPLTFNGVTKSMNQWAISANIPPETFRHRVNRGVDPFKSHK